jgi:FkbM family methyltransferase
MRQMTPATLARKAAFKLLGLMLGLMLLPITGLLHLAGYRHVTVFTDRIGHLALEPDCLLREQALGHIPRRKWIMLAPPGRVANEHLLSYWQSHFHLVRSKAACFFITSMSSWGLMRYGIDHYVRAIGKAQAVYRIYADWSSRPPLLRLNTEDDEWGNEMLEQLGVPKNAWFVCVHAREADFSPIDEELHSHRNSHIENIIPAAQEIVKRGGWAIRIGDPSMLPLPPLAQVIDYAHHPLKSPRLDIILCAKARFILGNTSGISLVGTIFGVPCVLANMIPVSAMGVSPQDISIPKLHWSKSEDRYLSFSEIFASPLSRTQYGRNFTDAGIRLEENTPEDIKELATEMLDRVAGNAVDDGEGTTRQQAFLGLLRPDHYSYGTASTIGSRFLKRHNMLQRPERISMLNAKLAIHHIGARGPTQAFRENPAFDASVVNVLYEADPDCITELEQLNSNRAAKVIVLNECVSGTGGPRTFCDAHHGYGSSLLEANADLSNLYIPAHWIDYDYTVYEAISAKSRREVATKTLDQIANERSDIPLPDFLSLDTQGSELEILRGSPAAVDAAVCIVTEVEFVPIYQDQPLFGEISAFLVGRGFVFARLFQLLNGSLYRAPLGLRGNGVPVTTDALFLKDPRAIGTSQRTAAGKAVSLAKLAFFSVSLGYVEHALWALNEAEHCAWRELDLAEPWFKFMLRFFEFSEQFPKLMPETFFERHADTAIGKAEFSRRTAVHAGELESCLTGLLTLLRVHHFDEAAEALLRQAGIDQNRLGLPPLSAAT